MNHTTKTITLVLISSALVFVGWGCPLSHEEHKDGAPHDGGQPRTYSTYRTGHSWFWYHSYYGPGYGWGGSSRPGGSATGTSGTASSRGGFGASAGHAAS